MSSRYDGSPRAVQALDAYVKLLRCADSVRGALEPSYRAMRLSATQFGVLEALFHLGPLHQHELGSKLLTSRANVTLVVDRLESYGLVRRDRDSGDRRYVTVRLTPEGRRRVRRFLHRHVERIVERMAFLDPDEQNQLGRICRKLGRADEA